VLDMAAEEAEQNDTETEYVEDGEPISGLL
jgi:hypothetical protein